MTSTPHPAPLPKDLAAYAERLLLGTGLNLQDAARAAADPASAHGDPNGATAALHAGWTADTHPVTVEIKEQT